MSRSLVPPNAFNDYGIVLHTVKYSDNKVIVHLLTKEHGRSNFMLTLSSRLKKNIFQPLSILYFQGTPSSGKLGKIITAELEVPLYNIGGDLRKATISIFVAEILYRILKEPLDDVQMYNFVRDSVIELDKMDGGVSNFHIWFLVHFAFFMGYQFPSHYSDGFWLDIKSGVYSAYAPSHVLRVAPQYAAMIDRFNSTQLNQIGDIELNGKLRSELLRALCDYFSYHCETFCNVKSIDILSEVF